MSHRKEKKAGKSGLNSRLKWSLIALALAALSIWAVYRSGGIDLRDLIRQLKSAKIRWLWPAAACMIGFIYFEGEAVRTILKSTGYPQKRSHGMIYAGADTYFSAITPSATGGQPAEAYFMMKDGVPGAMATAALLLNLIMYNAAVLSIGTVCLITRPSFFRHFRPICQVLIVCGYLVLLGMAIVFLMLLWKQKILHVICEKGIGILTGLHLMKNPEKWREKLRRTMEEYKECVTVMAGQRKMWLRAYLFNICQRMSQLGVTLFSFLALGGKAGLLYDLFATQVMVVLGSNCVPIPGSMGVTDYLQLDGYMALMDRNASYALQMISRGMSFYGCVLISGLIALGAFLLQRRRAAGQNAGQLPHSPS